MESTMRSHRIVVGAALFLGVVVAMGASGQQAPQTGAPVDKSRITKLATEYAPPSPDGPAPRLPNGKPDLSGVWLGGGPAGNIEDGLPKGESLPLRAEAKKLKDSRLAKDEPVLNCLPTGVPRRDLSPWRFVQTPTHVFILFEFNNQFRQIFVDGRTHPSGDALNPTWFGHSIGRWDGDTFVVDSVGFNDRSWFDYVGHPHTEQLHVVERYTRKNLGTLVNEITIDDPGAYTRPFKVAFSARLVPGWELMESICNENSKDAARMLGPAVRTRVDGTVDDGRR